MQVKPVIRKRNENLTKKQISKKKLLDMKVSLKSQPAI